MCSRVVSRRLSCARSFGPHAHTCSTRQRCTRCGTLWTYRLARCCLSSRSSIRPGCSISRAVSSVGRVPLFANYAGARTASSFLGSEALLDAQGAIPFSTVRVLPRGEDVPAVLANVQNAYPQHQGKAPPECGRLLSFCNTLY